MRFLPKIDEVRGARTRSTAAGDSRLPPPPRAPRREAIGPRAWLRRRQRAAAGVDGARPARRSRRGRWCRAGAGLGPRASRYLRHWNATVVNADITEVDLGSATFDLVMLNDVMEHVMSSRHGCLWRTLSRYARDFVYLRADARGPARRPRAVHRDGRASRDGGRGPCRRRIRARALRAGLRHRVRPATGLGGPVGALRGPRSDDRWMRQRPRHRQVQPHALPQGATRDVGRLDIDASRADARLQPTAPAVAEGRVRMGGARRGGRRRAVAASGACAAGDELVELLARMAARRRAAALREHPLRCRRIHGRRWLQGRRHAGGAAGGRRKALPLSAGAGQHQPAGARRPLVDARAGASTSWRSARLGAPSLTRAQDPEPRLLRCDADRLR